MKLAGGIIKDDTNKILLIHRIDPRYRQWEIPGGKVEPDESTQQTAIRELKEELGVEVKLIRSMGTQAFQEENRDYEFEWFEAEVISGEVHLVEKAYDKLDYFSITDMQSMYKELSPNAKNFVNAVAAKEVLL